MPTRVGSGLGRFPRMTSLRSTWTRISAGAGSAPVSVRRLLGLGLLHRLRQGRKVFLVFVAVRLELRVHVVRVGPVPLLPGVGECLARRASLLVLAMNRIGAGSTEDPGGAAHAARDEVTGEAGDRPDGDRVRRSPPLARNGDVLDSRFLR